MNIFTELIAKELQLKTGCVYNTISLLEEGCTIPFIARYRKERTGGLDDVQIGCISSKLDKLKEIDKRKGTILKSIEEQGKLDSALKKRIEECWDANMLEDIYMPYKPKRKTRAQVARDRGLEPLATVIMMQRESNIRNIARRTIEVAAFRQKLKETGADINDFTVDDALQGAKDIIAENVSENEQCRQQLRTAFAREAVISAKVVKAKADTEEARKYSDYFDFSEPLARCAGNRLLAIRRGEAEGVLRVKITIDDERAATRIKRHYVKGNGECSTLVEEAVDDAYKRLLLPSIENETAATSRNKAEDEAIEVFSSNLRQLLLAAPLGQKTIMCVDPGIRTGCKVVVVDSTGNLLYHTVVYTFEPKGNAESASKAFAAIAEKYGIEAVAVGNGTASRETTDILKTTFGKQKTKIPVYVVSEDGASVYSASKTAREEFPDQDVTVRGAVSIARRLMDPLAELVKIDPKSIGVGQYQHDVDQTKLKKSLDMTVENCVNLVGVNVNTASIQLLTYISGLGPALAKNIIDYRKANGYFTSRAQLKKVPRLGANAFMQCAGFLRIPDAKNPLDNTAVHPESYHIVGKMAADCGYSVAQLIENKDKQKEIDLRKYITPEVGMPTLNDIMDELKKPGRDPRGDVEEFAFDDSIHDIVDLVVGMVVPGIVTNITKFGAFVDIGVHHDGLVHISQMSYKFISSPNEVVKLQQHVMVKVTEIDLIRKRIGLSMKI